VHATPTLNILRRAGVPFVASYIYEPRSRWPNIGFSNQAAMRQVGEHLVQLGHRDIGMFAGVTHGNDRAAKRLAGMRECLRRHGLALNAHATMEIPYTIEAARSALARLVERGRLPSALACGNDIIALGVLFEAAAQGIRVPDDLSVAGFDNAPITAHVHPTLTTVTIPVEEMGTCAAEALLHMIDSGRPAQSVKLDAPLLVRESTAPPRKGAWTRARNRT
jgi:LacI family transcriptional regulator